MTRYLLVVAALFVSVIVPSPVTANHPSLEEACADMACRPAADVRIKTDYGEYIAVPVASRPYVFHGLVSIIPGETIYIEAVPQGGILTDLRYVPAVDNPDRTMTLKLEQVAELGMVLTVSNPFSKPLKYRAGIHRLGYEEFHTTSICPVPRGLKSYEHWPEPLIHILLVDFRFIDENDQDDLACN